MSTATLARPAVISEHDDYAADLAADLAAAAPARTVIVSGCVACAAEQGPHDCAAYTVPLAQRSVIAAPATIGGAL